MKRWLKLLFCYISMVTFFACYTSANAESTGNVTANEFASEAGAIGGAVKACGQDISEYDLRVLMAINIFAKTTTDSQQAFAIYKNALSKAEDIQRKNRAIDCQKAISDFQHLPLMRADYKETVLPSLEKIATPTDKPVVPVEKANHASK